MINKRDENNDCSGVAAVPSKKRYKYSKRALKTEPSQLAVRLSYLRYLDSVRSKLRSRTLAIFLSF